MGRYFYLQLKRLGRALPGAALVMLLLLGSLFGAWRLLVTQNAQGEENQKITIAMVGTAEDTLLQMGLSAIQSFDSSQFSMELTEMTEPQARQALSAGRIAAYVVIPENFAQEALDGNIQSLKFVSTTGAAGLATVFKEEVTAVISDLLLQSQQGVYGMQSAMREEGIKGRGTKMTELAFTYVDYVLSRDKVYTLEELGISRGLGFADSLVCGLGVALLLLGCLAFAPTMIRRDLALQRVLAARGRPAFFQCLAEFGAYGLLLLLLTAPLWLAAPGAALPVVLLAATYSYCLFTLASDLISGLLLQFFTTAALCFVSGCFYPVHFFPVSVQRLAAWLPTGLARDQLATALGGTGGNLWALLGCCLAFWALGTGLRMAKIREARV